MGDKLHLHDGSMIDLANWNWADLRSAFIVDPSVECSEWHAFAYSTGHQVPGANDFATKAHTNLRRSGLQGLFRDWEMLVYKWRATSSLPLGEELMEFASQCEVTFHYNDKLYRESTLDELLLGTCDLAGGGPRPDLPKLPIHMREGLMFEVVVECAHGPREKFRQFLIEKRTRATLWVKLEGYLLCTVY